MGIIVLASIYVKDKQSFNSLLANLGDFGGFLGGVGTVIAAAAAAVGVDNWLKQLRVGKSLVVIWDVQIALRKVHALEISWYVSAYQRSSDFPVDKLEEEIIKAFEVLDSCAHHLDAVVVRNHLEWSMKVTDVCIAWKEIKSYLDSHPRPETIEGVLAEDKILVPKNLRFSEVYTKYLEQLEKLEAALK
ncbi:TPA: hypothetical protein RQK57_004367 [Vibrio vulnificus]|nr:hypothetical protein [Vibrio vulnificus]